VEPASLSRESSKFVSTRRVHLTRDKSDPVVRHPEQGDKAVGAESEAGVLFFGTTEISGKTWSQLRNVPFKPKDLSLP
jgi:hypothetical protein